MGYYYLCIMSVELKCKTLGLVLNSLIEDDIDGAKNYVNSRYPFKPINRTSRSYSKKMMLEVFIKDGFVDRYSGKRLVFPGTLRAISLILPNEFPFHPNGKTSECHIAFWELFPTIDHIKPFSLGGNNDIENLYTTSMIRNGAKSLWSIEQLDWKLHPPGDVFKWNGLVTQFLELITSNPQLLEQQYIRDWHKSLHSVSKFW